MRSALWTLLAMNALLVAVILSDVLETKPDEGGVPNANLPTFALVAEIPPVEPICYRLGPWQGAAMEMRLSHWLDEQNVHYVEHTQSGETPTIEVWVDAKISKGAEVRERLAQALTPALIIQEQGPNYQFLVGRFSELGPAQALVKKLQIRLFSVRLVKPKQMMASGFFEFKWPGENARPDVSEIIQGLPGADQVVIEVCPRPINLSPEEPWHDPGSGTDALKSKAATA
jgi:hypothetical protein